MARTSLLVVLLSGPHVAGAVCGFDLLGYDARNRSVFVAQPGAVYELRLMRDGDVLVEDALAPETALAPLVRGTAAVPVPCDPLWIFHSRWGLGSRRSEADGQGFACRESETWGVVDVLSPPDVWSIPSPGVPLTDRFFRRDAPELVLESWRVPGTEDMLICGELVLGETRAGRLLVLRRRPAGNRAR